MRASTSSVHALVVAVVVVLFTFLCALCASVSPDPSGGFPRAEDIAAALADDGGGDDDASAGSQAAAQLELVHAFAWLNFSFRTSEEARAYEADEVYRNVALAGVQVSRDGDYFISTPRWKAGVPATLSRLTRDAVQSWAAFDGEVGAPLLEPYPSWEWNRVGQVDALQSVLGMEVDENNHLYVLDMGRVNDDPALPGSIKLVVFDLNVPRDTYKVLLTHVFPEDVVPLTGSFLNDLVVDRIGRKVFISDSGVLSNTEPHPESRLRSGIVVLDLVTHESWRRLSGMPSTSDDEVEWLEINGQRVFERERLRVGIDGIALSPGGGQLLWCPLTSRHLYSISTHLLSNRRMPDAELESKVVTLGNKEFASDGLTTDENGNLYLTFIDDNSVGVIGPDALLQHTKRPGGYLPIRTLVEGAERGFVWPDTFAFDHQGSLIVNSNHLHLFMMNKLNYTDLAVPNYAIWKVDIGAKSYAEVGGQRARHRGPGEVEMSRDPDAPEPHTRHDEL